MSSNDTNHGVDLAGEEDFVLGALRVCPSTNRVSTAAIETRIEPRVMEVLVTLWKAGERTVTRDQLTETCWNGRVVSDHAITRVIAKIRRLAQADGTEHFTLETVPKVGFRLIPAKSEPRADMAVDKPASASPLDTDLRSALATEQQSRWLHRAPMRTGAALFAVAAIVLVVALGLGLFPIDRSIAHGEIQVSAFDVLGPEAALGRLSAKTRDAVARLLTASGLPTRLAVATHGPQAELEVGGAIDHDGSRYAARVWIEDRSNRAVLWSRSFESGEAGGIGLDQTVASAIAEILKCGLQQRSSAGTRKPIRFTDVLSACTALYQGDQSGIEATRRLVVDAPDNAATLGLRAVVLAAQADELDEFKDQELAMVREARVSAEKAIALDANAVLAHVALGFRLGDAPRFAERERALRRALAIDPNSHVARIAYMRVLREVGRLNAAIEIASSLEDEADQRLQTAPLLPNLYAMAGDLPAANRILDRMDVTRPEDARAARWTVAMWWQDPRQLQDQFWQFARKEFAAGKATCVKKYFERLTRAGTAPHGLPTECRAFERDWQVRMLAREGDIDSAYELMNDGLPNSRRWTMFLFYPEMAAFRHDLRFTKLAERLGLTAYWRETNALPDYCAAENMPERCP